MTEPVYDVTYVNEHGERTIDADFSLAQAAQMAVTLYTVTSAAMPETPAWGRVTSVTITPTTRVKDPRSIREIEEQVIS